MIRSLFTEPELPPRLEAERNRIVIFRRYLAIFFGIFSLGLLLELLIDFKASDIWTFITVQAICIFFFSLSVLNVTHRYVITLNIIFVLISNQLNLLANPQSFHVLVYWIGITPLFIAVLSNVRATLIWTGILAAFIILNGWYISYTIGSYNITVYLNRFMVGGLVFALTASVIAAFFSITQKRIREKLIQQNQRLVELTEEIQLRIEELKNYNDHLEERVFERTEKLEHQNKQLTEYAFINSHLLRGPLARILGIADLLKRMNVPPEQQEYLNHLETASGELDEVITKINKALGQEGKFSRETFQQLNEKGKL